MIPWLKPADPPDAFPPVTSALTDPDGLLCVGGDLRPERLLAAYRRGIFPWYSDGQPILWWSPDPRMVLLPDEFKVSRSLGKSLRNRGFRVTFDTCFEEVIAHCADSGTRAAEGTWISPAIRAAYCEMHRLGFAHSVEVWLDEPAPATAVKTASATVTAVSESAAATTHVRDGVRRDSRLVGGLYGLLLGRIFFGESMFSTATDASKVALHELVGWLRQHNVELIDCQVASDHLFTLGARLMPRAEFVARLEHGIRDIAPVDGSR
jgi:leucyl/phenylalanyl-tRNA--protein transferase